MRLHNKRFAAAAIAAAMLLTLAPAGGSTSGSARAATLSVEVAATRGADLNTQRAWLQLLADLGAPSPRVRAATPGDRPSLETFPTAGGEVHRLVGVLDRRGRLLLPGGSFVRQDRDKLRDYLERLKADGRNGVLAPTGPYGLTAEQFKEVFDRLSQPVGVTTAGRRAEEVVAAAAAGVPIRLGYTPGTAAKLRGAPPLAAELKGFSVGATLAIALRSAGLALTPVRARGGPVWLEVRREGGGRPWPIGYKVEGPPRNTAPSLMQAIEVEIEGFSLAEATDAIQPRLDLPLVWDTAELARRRIDPASVRVKLPRAKLSYNRILQKLLFQARLGGTLKTDEAGKPFYWITK